MPRFDDNGDLLIDVDLASLPADSKNLPLSNKHAYKTDGGFGYVVTELNLTQYVWNLIAGHKAA